MQSISAGAGVSPMGPNYLENGVYMTLISQCLVARGHGELTAQILSIEVLGSNGCGYARNVVVWNTPFRIGADLLMCLSLDLKMHQNLAHLIFDTFEPHLLCVLKHFFCLP